MSRQRLERGADGDCPREGCPEWNYSGGARKRYVSRDIFYEQDDRAEVRN